MAADTDVDADDVMAWGHRPIGCATSTVGAVSPDQHSTRQTGRMCMQRRVFHLPDAVAARDAFAHTFAERFAAPFFRLTEARPTGVADVRCSVGTVDGVLKKPEPAPWPPGRRKVGLPLFKGEACVS